MRKHLLTFLNSELKMNSFRNASTIYKTATDADYIKKLKQYLDVKVT